MSPLYRSLFAHFRYHVLAFAACAALVAGCASSLAADPPDAGGPTSELQVKISTCQVKEPTIYSTRILLDGKDYTKHYSPVEVALESHKLEIEINGSILYRTTITLAEGRALRILFRWDIDKNCSAPLNPDQVIINPDLVVTRSWPKQDAGADGAK